MRNRINTTTMLKRASSEGYCIPAFNVLDLMTMETAVYAANSREAPVIIQTSSASVKRFGFEALVKMADIARKKTRVPVPLHLDHGVSFEAVKTAMDAGYDSVMMDVSSLPFAENVSLTREVVAYARAECNYGGRNRRGSRSGGRYCGFPE